MTRFVEPSLQKKEDLVTILAGSIANQRTDSVSVDELLASQARGQIEEAVYRAYRRIPDFNKENAVVYDIDSDLSVEDIICGFKRGCACAQMLPSVEIVGIGVKEMGEIEENYNRGIKEILANLVKGNFAGRKATKKVQGEITKKYVVFASPYAFKQFQEDRPHAKTTWRDEIMGENGTRSSGIFIGVSLDAVERWTTGKGRNILYQLFFSGKPKVYRGDKRPDIIKMAEQKVSQLRNEDLKYEINRIHPGAYSTSSPN